jgi:hypothetical protein
MSNKHLKFWAWIAVLLLLFAGAMQMAGLNHGVPMVASLFVTGALFLHWFQVGIHHSGGRPQSPYRYGFSGRGCGSG